MTQEEALHRAESLCSRSEHCEWDIRLRLRRWNVDPTHHDAIIQSLRQNRFLDDLRYIKAFVHDKSLFAGWGDQKIQLALQSKRLPEKTIREVLLTLNQDELLNTLIHLLQKKMRHLQADSERARREKLLRFAITRGYTVTQAQQALQHLHLTDLTDE